MKWLSRLLRDPAGPIAVDRLQHIFDYAIRFNASGRGKRPLGELTGLGTNINFESVPREIDRRRSPEPYRRDEIIHAPPHLMWYGHSVFAYVGLVDGRVQYRYGERVSSWSDAPVTHDRERIAAIARMFDLWYDHLGLPTSLGEPTEVERVARARAAVAGKDDAGLIRHYLSTRDSAFLFDVLDAENGGVLWVDWGEEDDAIVNGVEAILRTGALSARFADTGDAPPLIVTWRGVAIPIAYPAGHADRDTTIVALNSLLQPDYELRLFTASHGSDTLAFLPLPADAWRDLDRQYREAAADLFACITPGTVMFGA